MTSNNSNYNENAEIPMEGAVHYEKEESPILENGTYSFRVLSMKREIVSPTNTMPRHTNVKFMMLLEDADGQSWKVWDNVRMYQKWLWKYAQLAKGIGDVPKDSTTIQIDWGRFVGKTGFVEVTQKPWKKSDGTEVMQNQFKYLAPGELAGDAHAATPAPAHTPAPAPAPATAPAPAPAPAATVSQEDMPF